MNLKELTMLKCEICGKKYNNYRCLGSHIKQKHNISTKEYYNKYLKKENEGMCECGKETNFETLNLGYRKFCSIKCSRNSNKVKEKQKKTNLEKYGVNNPSKNKEIIEKRKRTNLKKYGFENPSQNLEIKEKKRRTSIKNWGVDNPNELNKIKEKKKQIFLEKYGVDNPNKNEEIVEKRKQTNLKKYGFEHPNKNEEIKNKISRTRKEKFIPILNESLKILDLEIIDNNYINDMFDHNWKCLKCGNIFNSKWDYIKQGNIRCINCFPKEIGYSKAEKEISEFIKLFNLSIVENDRNIIKPHELDIYIPSKNIAIEFDGLYYHSELFKDKNYHLNKTELCESKNIQLIHIFEDEWLFKQDIVKSRLKQLLNLNNDLPKIYARKCEIREIDSKTKNLFLNKYHIQGEDKSNIKLGAFYNNKLISVMTFSKGNISRSFFINKGIYELSRFCSNYSYHIIGIASKLLSHFKKNYEWKEIFSYADRRWSIGNLYKKIGFEFDSFTKPNYWYVKGLNRIHRFNLRKRYDEPKDIPEYILRTKDGYSLIWDCGHYKFTTIKEF